MDIDYNEIVKLFDDYNQKSTEEIQQEIMEIFKTWKFQGLHILAEQSGVKKTTIYQMVKRCVKYRPSFEAYCRIMAVGKNVYYQDCCEGVV